MTPVSSGANDSFTRRTLSLNSHFFNYPFASSFFFVRSFVRSFIHFFFFLSLFFHLFFTTLITAPSDTCVKKKKKIYIYIYIRHNPSVT